MDNKTQIMVALSGGVDSSVAGYIATSKYKNVYSGFMINWDSLINNDILGNTNKSCTNATDLADAKNIAAKLNIPLYEYNFIEEYWNSVFVPFIKSFSQGKTPNPDIFCNKYIKFKNFFNKVDAKLSIDYFITGHYAKVIFNLKTNEYELHRAKDLKKDQTYFLSFLNQSQLSRVIFPLANLTKDEVRKIANEQGFITATKKDSTGICFIGEKNFKLFLQNYIKPKTGLIIDWLTKKTLGKHDGSYYFTIGQRKNLNIKSAQEPYYVFLKDSLNNIIYVVNKSNSYLLKTKRCIVENINWISPCFSEIKNENLTIKFRHSQQEYSVKIKKLNEKQLLLKYEPAMSVAPGQIAVFYSGSKCLGGGVIKIVEYIYNRKEFINYGIINY